MTFLDDLKLAGLQSLQDGLNNPDFRRNITPPIPPGTNPSIAAYRRGIGQLTNTAADYYSDRAQGAINGILGLGNPDGPLPPGSGYGGGQIPGNSGPGTRGAGRYRVQGIFFFSGSTADITFEAVSVEVVQGPTNGEIKIRATLCDGTITLIDNGSEGYRPEGFSLEKIAPFSCNGNGIPDNSGGPNPDHPINPGGNHPGSMRFGSPYIDNEGNLRIPFNVGGEGWALGGSFNPATGEWDFGPPLPEDEFGNPIGDPNRNGEEPETPDDDCVKEIICGEDEWPISVPSLLTDAEAEGAELTTLPQAIAWLIKNFDAVSGQYPIEIKIKDTDPLTSGDQSQTVSLPNQAETMAEIFGLVYESNVNSELAVNMIFRLIPEVIAAKNSSLTAQDYVQAITNWAGFRTKAVARKIDSNFNPLQSDSFADFLKPSKYEIEGVEDDDPHTLVEWVQQIKYAVAVMKASVFRSPKESDNLQEELKAVADNPTEDPGKGWETFIDALNRANSNLTDRDFHPRPRATAVNDVLNPSTVLPDKD